MMILPKCLFDDNNKIKSMNNKSIDIELIPLINELNKAGLKTLASCSGHKKQGAYILFDLSNMDIIISKNHLAIYWKMIDM